MFLWDFQQTLFEKQVFIWLVMFTRIFLCFEDEPPLEKLILIALVANKFIFQTTNRDFLRLQPKEKF